MKLVSIVEYDFPEWYDVELHDDQEGAITFNSLDTHIAMMRKLAMDAGIIRVRSAISRHPSWVGSKHPTITLELWKRPPDSRVIRHYHMIKVRGPGGDLNSHKREEVLLNGRELVIEPGPPKIVDGE